MTNDTALKLFLLLERAVKALERSAAAQEAMAWPVSCGQPPREETGLEGRGA